MREYSLEINDVEYPFTSLYYKRSAPFVEEPITATIPGKQTVTGEDKIEILEDAVVKTTGRVHNFGYTKGKGGVFTKIIGSTLERDAAEIEEFARLFNQPPNLIITRDITLIATIKAVPRLTAGVINGYGSNLPFEFGSDWDNRWNIKPVWQRVALVTGWEIYVSPTGVVDFKAACGVDRGKTPAVSTTKFQSGENILNWTKPHFEDHTMIAGEVFVIGRKEGVFQAYASAGAGNPVRKIYLKDLHTPDTCQAAATAILADMANPVVTGRFNAIDEGLTYDVYDTVQIVDEDYGIDADYRIYEFEKWITPEKAYIGLMYTNLTKMTGNGPLLIGRGKGTLLKGQEALKQITTTKTSLKDEARLYKFSGEDITGYNTGTIATGVVTVNKDWTQLQTGVGVGRSWIRSITPVIDFANDFGLDVMLKINNVADPVPERRAFIGAFNAAFNRAIWVDIDGFELYGVNQNAAGLIGVLLIDPMLVDTYYRVSAFKRYDKIYWYLDGIFMGSSSAQIPTGTAYSTVMDQLATANVGARNFILDIPHFETSEKYNPVY